MMQSENRQGPWALSLEHVSKQFGATRALDDVSLRLRPGEMHGLVGLNGSGKSTLVKVLSGYLTPDPHARPRCELWGQPTTFPISSPEHLGIAVVQQDLALCKEMSVTDNLNVMGAVRPIKAPLSRVSRRREKAEIEQFLASLGWDLDPGAMLSSLTAGAQALVSIARALMSARSRGGQGSTLILDEPTAYLTQEDSERLFLAVRDLATRGNSVIVVSHRLDDVTEMCHWVTVLRGGRMVGSEDIKDVTKQALTTMMTGRALGATPTTPPASAHDTSGPAVLELQDVSCGRARRVSLEVGRGEIVGCTGLLGSSPEDLPYGIVGAKPRTGRIVVGGTDLKPGVPRAAAAGLAIVPDDRMRRSLGRKGSVADNFGADILNHDGRHWRYVSKRGAARAATAMTRQYGVVTAGTNAEMWQLSGGNQQKVVLARALELPTLKLLLLHEPTAGVDVDARASIHAIIKERAAAGLAVLVCSSDVEAIAGPCTRILVFADGTVARELLGASATAQDVALACQEGVAVSA